MESKPNQTSNENNDNQSEVISIIAHQIRSPLATIRLSHQTLLENHTGNLSEQQISLLQQATKRADRIYKLTEELLKVERGLYFGAELNLTEGLLHEFIDNLLTELEVSVKVKDLQIIKHYDHEAPSIKFDHSLLTDAVTNLLDNAISYTPEGGAVSVSTKYENDKITVKISDSGPGIPEEEVGSLFKKYSRLKSGIKNRHDGLGLGLHVAKLAVEKHGGEMWYEPNEPYGSSFVFSIPTTL